MVVRWQRDGGGMNLGDAIVIPAYCHGYPLGWVSGENYVMFPADTWAVFLEEIQPSYDEPRTFWVVATPSGILKIYSGFVKSVG